MPIMRLVVGSIRHINDFARADGKNIKLLCGKSAPAKMQCSEVAQEDCIDCVAQAPQRTRDVPHFFSPEAKRARKQKEART
jgi:hypothetical protein